VYLQGILTVDPAQLTHIDRVQPTKGFAKMAYFLTAGTLAEKEERETFCAITILQKINKIMRSVGVNNIVKLATDRVVFYEDTEGREDDLQDAFDAFKERSSSEDVTHFNELQLVLEHHLDEMACLIDIRILRTHAVGKHPITITLNGMPNELTAAGGDEQVRARLSGIFSSQGSYDEYVGKYQAQLQQFLDAIETNFHDHMRVDDVGRQTRVKIIRPKQRINRETYRQNRNNTKDSGRHDGWHDYDDPAYHGYHGFDDFFFYSWLWSDYMHDQNIHCHDCDIVDERGEEVLEVGEAGFVAGVENDTLNADEPFSIPAADDVTVCAGHDYSDAIDTTRVVVVDAEVASGGGWLSDFADSVSDSFSGGDDSGGSSCSSSCGSCGGD